MGKTRQKKDPAWAHCEKAPNPTGGSFTYVECNYCSKVIKGGITRMKHHLAWSHKNVMGCPNVSDEIKAEFMALINKTKKDKEKRQDEFDNEVDCGAYYGSGSGHGSNPSNTQSVVGNRNARGPLDKFLVHDDDEKEDTNPSNTQAQSQGMAQTAKEARKLVALDIGRFFFENGISFNCIESASFVSMCRSIAAYGKGLKPPSRHELGTWILKEEVGRTKVDVEEIKKTWIQTGVSILSDGWKDMRGRSLINFLVNNSYGTVFLKSIDASDAVKDANMIFRLLDDIVEEVGEELVLQIVTDNASNYKAAGKLLMEKRRRLYWTPCAAHCIDLMLEKLGELPQHKNALRQARKICNSFSWMHFV